LGIDLTAMRTYKGNLPNFRYNVSHLDSFFFSSRRRHTRFDCDWSSDVCSSDLNPHASVIVSLVKIALANQTPTAIRRNASQRSRSEERRVGKECRSWWSA